MDPVLVLLTGVIAAATVAQALFAWRLFKLQRSVEASRMLVDVEARLVFYQSTDIVNASPKTVDLQVVNLSPIGIWVESAEFIVELSGDAGSARLPFPIEDMVPAFDALRLRAEHRFRSVLESIRSMGDSSQFRGAASLEVGIFYRAYGQARRLSTGRCPARFGQYGVERDAPRTS